MFNEYPDIKQAYELSCELSDIYNRKIDKGIALTKMAKWFKGAEESGIKSFNTIRRTFEQHYSSIRCNRQNGWFLKHVLPKWPKWLVFFSTIL